MPYLSPALNVMTTAARKAGRGLIRDFGELENLQVSLKGPMASEATQLTNAFTDPVNRELAAKAHVRPSPTTSYEFPR